MGACIYIQRRLTHSLVFQRAGPGIPNRSLILQLLDAFGGQILQTIRWPPCYVQLVVPKMCEDAPTYLVHV